MVSDGLEKNYRTLKVLEKKKKWYRNSPLQLLVWFLRLLGGFEWLFGNFKSFIVNANLDHFQKTGFFSEVFRVLPIRNFKIMWLQSSETSSSSWPRRIEAVATVVRFSILFKVISILFTFAERRETAPFTSMVKIKLVWNTTWRDNLSSYS